MYTDEELEAMSIADRAAALDEYEAEARLHKHDTCTGGYDLWDEVDGL